MFMGAMHSPATQEIPRKGNESDVFGHSVIRLHISAGYYDTMKSLGVSTKKLMNFYLLFWLSCIILVLYSK